MKALFENDVLMTGRVNVFAFWPNLFSLSFFARMISSFGKIRCRPTLHSIVLCRLNEIVLRNCWLMFQEFSLRFHLFELAITITRYMYFHLNDRRWMIIATGGDRLVSHKVHNRFPNSLCIYINWYRPCQSGTCQISNVGGFVTSCDKVKIVK